MTKVKVKVLRPFLGNEGKTRTGDVIEVSEPRARELERLNLAITLVGAKMESAPQNKAEAGAPKNKGAAGKASADPTPSRQTGGRTGAAKPASSSAPAPQPKALTSTVQRAKPAASRSTVAGASPRGRTSYTAATSRGGKGTKGSKRLKG